MSTVYVRWYGKILEGEVADGEGFMGMTPVRIPLDGHHPVALFFPQHVYESAEQAKMHSSPVNSPNPPRSFPELPGKTEEFQKLTEISKDQSKVDESLTKVDDNPSKVDTNDCLTLDDRYHLDVFKSYNWDDEHNHLRTDKLDEFYQMWREMLRPFGFVYDAEASVTCQSHTPKPVSAQPVPQNGTPSNTKPQNKKMRCWRCEHLDFDHILCRQENRPPGEHYCGLHGMARVDPDGPQQNLDHKGGCGFTARKQAVELSLFD